MAAGVSIISGLTPAWQDVFTPAAGASIMLQARGGPVEVSVGSSAPSGQGIIIQAGQPPVTLFGGQTAAAVTLPHIWAKAPGTGCYLAILASA